MRATYRRPASVAAHRTGTATVAGVTSDDAASGPAPGLASFDGWPGQRRAVGWVDRQGREALAGDADDALPLASVTKVLTALGVLVAAEEEVLSLDEAAGPAGSTVRLL